MWLITAVFFEMWLIITVFFGLLWIWVGLGLFLYEYMLAHLKRTRRLRTIDPKTGILSNSGFSRMSKYLVIP